LILTSIVIVISLIVGVNTTVIVYRTHESQQPLSAKYSILETNFLNLDLESFGIYPRTLRIVSATASFAVGTGVFTSSRDTSIIKQYIYSKQQEKPGNLKFVASYDLNRIIESTINSPKKFWVFDLQVHNNQIYVSLVTQTQKKKSCDDYMILQIPISDEKLKLKANKKIWKFGECISSFPGDPGWYDFQGRLAVTDESVYMTAGLLVAATYSGFYPNPNLSGLMPTLKEEIARDKLFGGVLKVNKTTGASRLFASGFRGPSGITVLEDQQREKIWVADHGPRGGDELNLVEEGKDYGWPWVTYGTKYFDREPGQSGYMSTLFGSHQGFTNPNFYWTPSIAPSQMASLTSSFGRETDWNEGDLLMGSLKAESLFHIKLNSSDDVESVEQISIGTRVRDLSIESRSVFVTTDDGRLIVLTPNSTKTSVGAFPYLGSISGSSNDGSVLYKLQTFLNRMSYSIQYRGTLLYRQLFARE
jgi:glucose/arabinose dehydrogenase